MIFIFNESTDEPKLFKLIITDPATEIADLYVRVDAKAVCIRPDLTMRNFHPCQNWHEVQLIIEPFGHNPAEDKVLYFRDSRLIPTLSSVCYDALFTVTN